MTVKAGAGAALFIILLVGGGTFAWKQSATFSGIAYRDLPGEEFKKAAEELIRAEGGIVAYQQFSEAISGRKVDEQHRLVHWFSEVLYATEGLNGFSACDDRFQYGCFHEIMGRAITEHGESVIPRMYEACLKTPIPRPGPCLHGIGHGIISSTGYSRSGLDTALALCGGLSVTKDLFRWCLGGVFMEYNQRSMLGQGPGRELGSAPLSEYEPCISLQEEHKAACVHELAPWWLRILHTPNLEEAFALMGSRCEQIPGGQELVRSCFEGVGNITTPKTGYDARRSAALCEVATRSDLHRLFCKSTAALSLAVSPYSDVAPAVCEGLGGEALRYCAFYTDKDADMAHPPAPPNFAD